MFARLLDIIDRFPAGRIIAAAVLLRLLFGLFWMLAVNAPPENVPVAGESWNDAGADGYLQIARTLLVSGEYAFEPGGVPVHNRPPVQVLLMLVFGAWLPAHWYVVWMFGSALLSLLMLLIVRRLAEDMDVSPRMQKLLLVLAGFHPYLVFITKTTTFINAAALLLVLVVWLTLRITRKRLQYAAVAGLAIGVGALTHGTFLLMPLLATPYILSRRTVRAGKRFAAAALVILCAAAVVAPWTLRNYQTFDRVIPVVTGNGYHYWKGEAVYFGGHYPMADLYTGATGKPFEEKYYGAVYPEADAVLWDLAKDDMRERPQLLPLRLLIGTGAFFAPWDGGPKKAVASAILNAPLLVILLYLIFRRRRELSAEQITLVVLLLYIVEAFAFFVSWGSYFTMILPLMLLLAVSLAEPFIRIPGFMQK